MSSIQAYKAHKQEGTIAATTLVSKMHKQGGIFEFPSMFSIMIGWQRTQRRKNLGTAHHNDASSTGYLITVTLHQYAFKRQYVLSTHASTLTNFTYHEKRIQTSK